MGNWLDCVGLVALKFNKFRVRKHLAENECFFAVSVTASKAYLKDFFFSFNQSVNVTDVAVDFFVF